MSQYCTSIYLCFLVLIFPLYYQNNYINILEAKTSIFTIVTIIYFIAMLMCFWVESVRAYEEEQKKSLKRKKPTKKKPASNLKLQGIEKERSRNWTTIFCLSLLLVLLISTILTGDFGNAWTAVNTQLFGTKILLLCIGIYFFVSKGFVMTKWLKVCLFLGLTAVFSLTTLNRFQIDPLQMYSNLLEEQHPLYLSTIGNVNILSGFLCVFLPLVIGLFLYAENRFEKCSYGFLVFLGSMAGISTNSDSFFLGFGAAMLVFLWFAMTEQSKMSQYVQGCMIIVLAMIGLNLLNGLTSKDIVWETIQHALLEKIPWLAVLMLLVMFLFFIKKLSTEKVYGTIRTVIFGTMGIFAIVFVIYVIKVNVSGDEAVSQYLIFSDSWGTNRGYAWRNTLELFGEVPWYQKLFGIGPGNFYEFFAEPNEIRVKPFVDPHSDYLFYLVTMGIFGFIAWLGMIGSAIWTCVKQATAHDGESAKPIETKILLSILLAWLAQGTVNTSLVFTTPYLFTALAVGQWLERK